MVGTVDVVSALVDRMTNATVSTLLSRIMGETGTGSASPVDLFTRLVPDADRRRVIVQGGARGDPRRRRRRPVGRPGAQPRGGPGPPIRLGRVSERAAFGAGPSRQCPRGSLGASGAARAEWVRSIGDEAVRELDSRLLGPSCVSRPSTAARARCWRSCRPMPIEAADDDDWPGVARAVELLIAGVASESADDMLRQFAVESLKRLSKAPLSARALEMLAGVEPPARRHAVRARSPASGPRSRPPSRPAGPRVTVRPRVPDSNRWSRRFGRPGREPLRRLLASEDEPAAIRTAAIRLLRLTAGSEHLPALEAALSDPRQDIRREAFAALADSSSARAPDILARGIARADAAAQTTLLTWLLALRGRRALPSSSACSPRSTLEPCRCPSTSR